MPANVTIPDDILAFIKEVSQSSATSYAHEHDEVGACACCFELSYRPHTPDCIFAQAKALQEKYNQ